MVEKELVGLYLIAHYPGYGFPAQLVLFNTY